MPSIHPLAIAIALSVGLWAGPAAATCTCDCDGNRVIRVNDLITMIQIALGSAEVSSCPEHSKSNVNIGPPALVRCVHRLLDEPQCPIPAATPTAQPSPTPTVFPPTDEEASRAATALLASVASRICGYRSPPGASPAGAGLRCRSGRGHEGSFTLRRYPSADAALAAFGIPSRTELVVEAAGGRLRELIDPCCRARVTRWSWHRDCWLASGKTFDDTPLVLSPRGPLVVRAFEGSGMLTDLIELCE